MRCGNRILNTAFSLTCHHQRIGRDLTGGQLQQGFKVAVKNLIGLAPESEDHVNIANREKFLRFRNIFKDFLSGSEFIAFGHLENAVIKALNTD